MPPIPPDKEDHALADQFLKRNRWKPGHGRNKGKWFLPSEELPHVSIFWTNNGTPTMTYNDESTGRGLLMVLNGKKMENFSLGVEKISEANPQSAAEGEEGELDDDRLKSTLRKTLVAMRNW
jgi:hypothetical protein